MIGPTEHIMDLHQWFLEPRKDLIEIAERYVELTESYDKRICGITGMPQNGKQLGMIGKNAREQMRICEEKAEKIGCTKKELKLEIGYIYIKE